MAKEGPTDPTRPNRRRFLRNSAALAGLAAGVKAEAQETAVEPAKKSLPELISYGERSRFVNSVRIPTGNRPSPDSFGLTFHVLTPLQDSVGSITPSSLHYIATHRGSYVPDI